MPRYAAIDIGSNSVRMETAEVVPGRPPGILASDREVTRLGEGVFREGRIRPEAAAHTCRVLARMAATYRALDVSAVRAVATSSVRDARNQKEFLDLASEAAGVPVEVISGREEARLIHLGVCSRWPQNGRRVLLLDIGGGSAEIILSEDGRMADAVSKPLGAVRLREMFLPDDPPDPRHLLQMEEYIRRKLAGLPKRFGAAGWNRLIATSATARTLALAATGAGKANREAADRIRVLAPRARELYSRLGKLSLAARRRVAGIGPRRAEIIVPGLAVFVQVLCAFGMARFYYSTAGVRDGIVADLAARGAGADRGRLSPDQRREVERLATHYRVPVRHLRGTAALARTLFEQLRPLHDLPMESCKYLEAAVYLHDAGHYVNDASHHKHSYYLIANSDLPGFTTREREFIANLCRYHRKSMPSPGHPGFRALPADAGRPLIRLIPLLRMALSLNPEGGAGIRSVDCRVEPAGVTVRVDTAGDLPLEMWAAGRVSNVFREVYRRPVQVTRTRCAR